MRNVTEKWGRIFRRQAMIRDAIHKLEEWASIGNAVVRMEGKLIKHLSVDGAREGDDDTGSPLGGVLVDRMAEGAPLVVTGHTAAGESRLLAVLVAAAAISALVYL